MIDGVKIKQLKPIADERGRLMEILRSDDEIFKKFGQVYITTIYPSVVKGWHYHKEQTDSIACVSGMIKLVLSDSRDDSPTQGEINEFFIGEHNPILVQIPPNVAHGMKGIADKESIILNIPDKPYNHKSPDEYRIPPHEDIVSYKWDRVDK